MEVREYIKNGYHTTCYKKGKKKMIVTELQANKEWLTEYTVQLQKLKYHQDRNSFTNKQELYDYILQRMEFEKYCKQRNKLNNHTQAI